MAQQDTRTEAALIQGVDRANFLTQTDSDGFRWKHAILGHHRNEHSVTWFCKSESLEKHTVTVSLQAGAFSLQEYLTPDEARTLAKALTLAADHADAGQHLLSASQRKAAQEQAQQQADEEAA